MENYKMFEYIHYCKIYLILISCKAVP